MNKVICHDGYCGVIVAVSQVYPKCPEMGGEGKAKGETLVSPLKDAYNKLH